MRLQVEVDTSQPLLMGFFQKTGKGSSWIQFAYERLADFCYNYGKLEHGKGTCTDHHYDSQSSGRNNYGPWLRAETDAYTLSHEGNYMRRVKLPRGEMLDTFTSEVNHDARNEAVDVSAGDNPRSEPVTEAMVEDEPTRTIQEENVLHEEALPNLNTS
ncbi:hypothetical protein FEM48_Zijuj09G0052200 [Ziziphus jujuba var. spinosa]|uniref:Zinc knuckle CX2CX4HX4C domain-containing protein n=1 Tax=Ziziphus jujuba var. spinosa TaxID=714518 RepID=A0A978UR26_ZIZJJ|nr:hypothetical protein FEM48_Zijuj09G0051700 [Ziziphus jujuba var. spinosa]KAH7517331.1 hypothetical protein FEM48_Zijuj09G0052200 [Ziziphus jujuba var. spinosa]